MRTFRQRVSEWFPLVRDCRAYLKYRRNAYRELDRFLGGTKGIESIHPVEALKRIQAWRFPGETWHEPQSFALRVNGDCETFELLFMAMVCLVARPRRIFEIGTYEGRSANVMALHTAPDCHIETLDLPIKGAVETNLKILKDDEKWLMKSDARLGGRLGSLPDSADNARITQHLGDSASFDYSSFHGKMDMVFVDGAHSYNYVISDAENGLKMLADRGFILFHDYVTEDDVVLACARLNQKHQVYHIAQTSYALLFPAA